MSNTGCAECAWRVKYDTRPKSISGRLWRWHINFCPGWKDYFTSLSDDEQRELAEKYSFTKYRN